MSEKLFVNTEFYVAGVPFHRYEEVKKELEVDMILTLIPDPENIYDSNAIKVMYQEVMIGFVPANTGEAKFLTSALKEGIKLVAIITKHEPDEAKRFRRLKIWVREEGQIPKEGGEN